MSFMFKPLAYDDPNSVNYIELDPEVKNAFFDGSEAVITELIREISVQKKEKFILCLDGYVSAQFYELAKNIAKVASEQTYLYDMKQFYKSQAEIDQMTQDNLPLNYNEDPVLLFGRLYQGKMSDLIDPQKLKELINQLKVSLSGLHIIYGIGSGIHEIRQLADALVYIDITPKTAAIRAREKKVVNIGDEEARPFSMLMRRNYYVDFEVVLDLRKELLFQNAITYYILEKMENHLQMLKNQALNQLLDTLVKYPFRAKPVYLEGIWGGEYIRKIRNIPSDISSNIAWIFEFIPMEVSIEIDISGVVVEIPFYTFVQKNGKEMMGESCFKEFQGYFPIRFNYDDTWHSNGNMSVQVHPDEDFIIENYDEFGRQDEAYYIIAVGHGAKTYVGWKGDGAKFLQLCKESEKDNQEIDYQRYINAISSVPGRQIMLPAGTIHASGRNQFILELGSLTVGSYTYKVYDYNRRDKEGKRRPIHTANAEKVLCYERNSDWVNQNIAIAPILLEKTDFYREYIVGQTDLMYYQTNIVEINTHAHYEGKNNGQFTVITLVDGEEIKVYSKMNPQFCYTQRYLEIVTIPATIEDYVIEAKGYQPVVVHKTFLRNGYTKYKNPKYNNR